MKRIYFDTYAEFQKADIFADTTLTTSAGDKNRDLYIIHKNTKYRVINFGVVADSKRIYAEVEVPQAERNKRNFNIKIDVSASTLHAWIINNKHIYITSGLRKDYYTASAFSKILSAMMAGMKKGSVNFRDTSNYITFSTKEVLEIANKMIIFPKFRYAAEAYIETYKQVKKDIRAKKIRTNKTTIAMI